MIVKFPKYGVHGRRPVYAAWLMLWSIVPAGFPAGSCAGQAIAVGPSASSTVPASACCCQARLQKPICCCRLQGERAAPALAAPHEASVKIEWLAGIHALEAGGAEADGRPAAWAPPHGGAREGRSRTVQDLYCIRQN